MKTYTLTSPIAPDFKGIAIAITEAEALEIYRYTFPHLTRRTTPCGVAEAREAIDRGAALKVGDGVPHSSQWSDDLRALLEMGDRSLGN